METPAAAEKKTRYEHLRNARISENEAGLASLGLDKSLSKLRAIVLSPKQQPSKQYEKKVYDSSSLRRSSRFKGETQVVSYRDSRPYSVKVKHEDVDFTPSLQGDEEQIWENLVEKNTNKYAIVPHHVKEDDLKERLLPEFSERRCSSKGRGSVYDSVYGICCHFCRLVWLRIADTIVMQTAKKIVRGVES